MTENRIGEDFDFDYIFSHFMEMSYKLKDILFKIDSFSSVRQAHLIKLYYYRNQTHYAENFKGWVASARKGYDNVPKVKGTNKFPTFQDLYDLWINMEDAFDEFHTGIVNDLNHYYTDFEKITEIDYDGVKKFVSEFNRWACELISKKGHIEYLETENKIKELLELN